MKKLLRCAGLVFALLPFLTSSSQAMAPCNAICCWGGGTPSSVCNDYGSVTTCGEWSQRTACP